MNHDSLLQPLSDAMVTVADHIDWGGLLDDVFNISNYPEHIGQQVDSHDDDHNSVGNHLEGSEQSLLDGSSHDSQVHPNSEDHETQASFEVANQWGSGYASWDHFDPNHAPAGIIGDPSTSMQYWQEQSSPDSCGVVSQLYALEELTGQKFSQEELVQEAVDNGWLGCQGMPMHHMGKLLELHGIEVQREHGCSYEHLRDELNQGHKVWVSLDMHEINTPGIDQDDSLAACHGLPGQGANHAVQVIGIDETSDPDIPKIILNNPGLPDGNGIEIPVGAFMGAWEDSRYWMVHTTNDAPQDHSVLTANDDTAQSDAHVAQSISTKHEPYLRGYYTGEGLYHWNSDNTDRDDCGKIIHDYRT